MRYMCRPENDTKKKKKKKRKEKHRGQCTPPMSAQVNSKILGS